MMGRSILKDFYDVSLASSTSKLFEILEKIVPDLIMLDTEIPEEDGHETIKKLKSDVRFASIPVVLLTSPSDKNSQNDGLALGVADYVFKPFSGPQLLKTVEKHINGKNSSLPDENDYKPCILAVDDAPDILKSVFFALRDEYRVFTLPNPLMLKDLMKKIVPDLFLLDYNMPVMSGFDLIPVIRGFKNHKDTPIVFLTSEGTIDNLSVAVTLGACDFIVKPFEPEALRDRIAKHVVRK
jgi:DNA-binding response OmpR family regulator